MTEKMKETFESMKRKLIDGYEDKHGKLKIIPQGHKKFIDADFLNYVIGELNIVFWGMKRILAEIEWTEAEDKIFEAAPEGLDEPDKERVDGLFNDKVDHIKTTGAKK